MPPWTSPVLRTSAAPACMYVRVFYLFIHSSYRIHIISIYHTTHTHTTQAERRAERFTIILLLISKDASLSVSGPVPHCALASRLHARLYVRMPFASSASATSIQGCPPGQARCCELTPRQLACTDARSRRRGSRARSARRARESTPCSSRRAVVASPGTRGLRMSLYTILS